MTRSRKIQLGALAVVVVGLVGLAAGKICLSAWLRYGVLMPDCPDGACRPTFAVDAVGMLRGAEGSVHVSAAAHCTTGPAANSFAYDMGRFAAKLALVAPGGQETPLEPLKGWTEASRGFRTAGVKLADLPDGEYKLRGRFTSPLGGGTVDAPLALFAPARVHVLTDRPLYEPGNTVRFRAVVLRARDLAPLPGRPGRWVVESPAGDTMLEEKAPAGEWGVSQGSFPLDTGAETGDWKVRWVSGSAEDVVKFRVEPFTLPRFRVEAAPGKPFYRAGERPAVKGSVVYSSGAPVAQAKLEIAWDPWSPAGAWPPPSDWFDGGLPGNASADAGGKFALTLPVVPGDLRGQIRLHATIAAVDPAGDRVATSLAILLSQDAIQVSAASELADGLVQGFNNRLYLRVTTADGTPLPSTPLVVKRAWDPSDKGVQASTDEDGVAALQLDPGPAVNVVIPPMPVRRAARPPAVQRTGASDKLADDVSLADLRVLDAATSRLAPCARFVEGDSTDLEVGISVAPAGTVRAVGSTADPATACVANAARALKFTAGRERLLHVSWTLRDADLPTIQSGLDGTPDPPEDLAGLLHLRTLDARSCVPRSFATAGVLPRALIYRTRPGSPTVETSWVPFADADADRSLAILSPCVAEKIGHLVLPKPADLAHVGVVRFDVRAADAEVEERPQASTMLGYELAVAALSDHQKEIGSTRIVLNPGTIPEIRMRATPVIPEPGGTFSVELLRGPSYSGELPKELTLRDDRGNATVSKVDPASRRATFQLPKDAKGWIEVQWGGARAVGFVPAANKLTVELATDQPRYAPGQRAQIGVRTTVGGKASPAAVTLAGVDESLGQLAALPGLDEMARVKPALPARSGAFGSLDAQALTMGRVRGAHAAAAITLRVGAIPSPEAVDTPASGRAESSFDPLEPLADHFFAALAEVHRAARAWEEAAPRAERMTATTMARIFDRAVATCEKRGEDVKDAFGRRLRLSRLPSDLLALVDPRAVVVDGTRLPEDVENWPAWVAKEQP